MDVILYVLLLCLFTPECADSLTTAPPVPSGIEILAENDGKSIGESTLSNNQRLEFDSVYHAIYVMNGSVRLHAPCRNRDEIVHAGHLIELNDCSFTLVKNLAHSDQVLISIFRDESIARSQFVQIHDLTRINSSVSFVSSAISLQSLEFQEARLLTNSSSGTLFFYGVSGIGYIGTGNNRWQMSRGIRLMGTEDRYLAQAQTNQFRFVQIQI